eukprot:TRINITY_DN6205_c0_g2_i1.p1 TRINITY_DN6205_c0_g2~~TRINITY_DN6205_c0_g2_i1.p1  ORF type:complete len:477 (+),score=86.63 TRINITY_DN6205_c0_g2_i1:52-1431(+)
MGLEASPTASRCLAEFIGVFLPFLSIGFNALAGHAALSSVSLAVVLTILTYALVGISGANFNPAVTISLYVSKRLGGPGVDSEMAGTYMAVQLVAGLCCGLCVVNLFSDSLQVGPHAGFSWADACFCEFLYSALVCFVVLNTTAARRYSTEGNQFFGLAIGGMLLAGSVAAGPVSGGFLNPAFTIGVGFAGAGFSLENSLIYASFQLLGGVAAASLFQQVRPGDFNSQQVPRTRLVSEAIGTFSLVVTVGLAVRAGSPMAVPAIAGCLMSLVYSLGDVSGAHFNPAVTTAVLVSGNDQEMVPNRAVLYAGIQITAGVVAGWVFCLVNQGNSFPVGPQKGFSVLAAAVAETLFTGLLAFVVLATAVSKRTTSTQLFGLAIGLCIVAGGVSAGKISGACLNPAVSIGIFASFGGLSTLKMALRYSFFQLCGGIMAGGLVKLTHATDQGEAKAESNPFIGNA